MTQTYILGESVFALSFNRKCGNFQRNRDFDNTISSVFACVYLTLNDTGVGIVSVLFTFGLCQSLFRDKRIGSTLSLYILT